MNEIIEKILVSFITSLMYMYIWKKLLNENYNYKSIKFYIIYLFFSLTILLNYVYVPTYIRISLITMIFVLIIKLFFDGEINLLFITALYSQIISMLSETIFAVIISIFIKNNDIINSFSGRLVTIIFLFIISALILKIKIVKKFNLFLIEKTNNIRNIIFVIFSLLFVLILNYLLFLSYFKVDLYLVIIINTLIILIYAYIIFKFLIIKNDYNSINSKYLNILDSLKEYEEMMDKYRVLNHENKNQLLLIKSMINNKDKKVTNYIDEIIDTTIKDNEKLMQETSIIPDGGIKAIIYSKMLYMKENNINVNLNVERKVRKIDLLLLNDRTILDICKIIGVFLDNAIEEVENFSKKEVGINFYVENENLCISISNPINKTIDLKRMDNVGFTTKGKNHGYGLSLVKKIINQSNNKLINERNIHNDRFTQILIINTK